MHDITVFWKQGNSSVYEAYESKLFSKNENILNIVCKGLQVYIPLENVEYWYTGMEKECLHKNIIQNDEYCKCADCGKEIWEWYCPDSPDYFCHYDNDVSGCNDICDYCGMPEERK